eukprot:COSAG05_NODE_23513_length_257_cov_0.981013_1_plen_52_part_01
MTRQEDVHVTICALQLGEARGEEEVQAHISCMYVAIVDTQIHVHTYIRAIRT